ncbi:hypothetical protein CDCA_CDCA10G2873 [Cyanidium caldarium]|uniref:GST N-terminal domain-containing protein n=1 Tax=Cyanidium caldarium TaxID=2771 RepID=A0AAV9IX20_CYACA|nr:hypothetical protein CDCA_CDCA10G2873 [Cyanidium caldarium]|eukprot:ctg_174.g109
MAAAGAAVSDATLRRLNQLARELPEEVMYPERCRSKRLIHFSFEEVVRLFDHDLTDEQVTVVLYRDPALWCPYCQRLQFFLEEKRLPYRTVHIPMWCYETGENPKPQWYMQMVPSGLLPAVKLLDTDQILIESLAIMQFLQADPRFAQYGNPRAVANEAEDARVASLVRMERELFSDWLRYLTGPPAMASVLRRAFFAAMDKVERALAASPTAPFFSAPLSSDGEGPGFVDCLIAPFLERIEFTMPFWKGIEIRNNPKWPCLERWYKAIEARPGYLKGNAYSTVFNLPPQVGRHTTAESERAAAAPFRDQVLNEARRLKFEPVEGDDDNARRIREARHEAGAALIRNFARVVRDMKRTCVDDDDSPGDDISRAMYAIAELLVRGNAATVEKVTNPTTRRALEHIRERVCVPRDLRTMPAQQFQAAVNHLLQ